METISVNHTIKPFGRFSFLHPRFILSGGMFIWIGG